MAKKQGVHAGPNGPRFVFGRENLDYQGSSHLSGQISPDMQNPANDFHQGKKYGEYGTLSNKEEDQRQVDLSKEFLRYLFDDGMNLQDFYAMDSEMEEDDEIIAEFINNHPDTVADDYERLGEEISHFELSRGLDALLEESADDPSAFQADNLIDDPGTVTQAEIRDRDMMQEYIGRMSDGDFRGSYDDYVGSYEYIEDSQLAREAQRESLDELVSVWSESEKTGPGFDHVVIEGSGMGWMGQSGRMAMRLDEFMENPSGAIAPDTAEFTQSWARTKDGYLTASQSHHDAMGELYVVKPLRDGQFYSSFDYGDTYIIDDVENLDELDAEEAIDYFDREWKLGAARDLAEKQGRGGTLDREIRSVATEKLDEYDAGDRIDEFMDKFYSCGFDLTGNVSLRDIAYGFAY